MRRLYPLSIILSLYFSGEAALAARQTLNAGRGFAQSKCYEEVASVLCHKTSSCSLIIYPGTRGQLSFLIEKKPEELTRDDVYFKALFRVTTSDSNNAKVLLVKKMHPSVAVKELGEATFLAKEVSCLLK